MLGCKPLSDTEIYLLLNNLDNARDKCLFILGTRTGFRISELLSIKIQDLLQYGKLRNYIQVSRSKMKGKVKSRSIPISESVRSTLQEYLNTLPKSQTYLFESQKGNKLSRIQAWRVIKDAATKAKIQGKVATHSARKSYAKRIYEASGKDLVMTQKALGHASVNSTISYLNNFSNEELDTLILKTQE